METTDHVTMVGLERETLLEAEVRNLSVAEETACTEQTGAFWMRKSQCDIRISTAHYRYIIVKNTAYTYIISPIGANNLILDADDGRSQICCED